MEPLKTYETAEEVIEAIESGTIEDCFQFNDDKPQEARLFAFYKCKIVWEDGEFNEDDYAFSIRAIIEYIVHKEDGNQDTYHFYTFYNKSKEELPYNVGYKKFFRMQYAERDVIVALCEYKPFSKTGDFEGIKYFRGKC